MNNRNPINKLKDDKVTSDMLERFKADIEKARDQLNNIAERLNRLTDDDNLLSASRDLDEIISEYIKFIKARNPE